MSETGEQKPNLLLDHSERSHYGNTGCTFQLDQAVKHIGL